MTKIKFVIAFVLVVSAIELWAMEQPEGYVPGSSPTTVTGLKACWVYTNDGVYEVHLTWNENPESDLIGYNVYWSLATNHGYQKLSLQDGIDNDFDGEVDEDGELVIGAWYEDPASLDRERKYYYRVTAVVRGYFESYWSEPADTGEPEDASPFGCFIATASYGNIFAPEVQSLREFRDRFLLSNSPGKLFIRMYYKMSPPIAQVLKKHPVLRYVVRKHLSVIVFLCRRLML